MDKKGQGILGTWIIAIAAIFSITIIFMLWVEPFQEIDDALTPKIDVFTVNGKTNTDLLDNFRNNLIIIPIVLVGGILVWAFLKSIIQDPNSPYQ